MLEKNGTPENDRKIVSLPVSILHPDPDQPRKDFDPAKLLVLGKSLQKKQDYPVLGYDHPTIPSHKIVADGGRRLAAALVVGKTHLDFLDIGKPASKAELRKLQIRTAVAREALNPCELADAIREIERAVNQGRKPEERITQLQLAEELGTTGPTLSRWLSIKRLAPDLKPSVECGDICSTAAYAIASLEKLEDQRAAMSRALGPPKMTKDQVVAMCDAMKGKREKKPPTIKTKTPGGCAVTVTPRPKMTPQAVLDELKEWLKVIGADMNRLAGNVTDDVLWGLFRRRGI